MKTQLIKLALLFSIIPMLAMHCTTPEDDDGYTCACTIDTGSPCTGAVVNLVTVTDEGNGTGTTTWTKNKVYILSGFVFVNSGQTLTIEAGTVIKGEYGTGANASALIVAQGGKIMAEGTADAPIIFTSIADNTVSDVNGTFCSQSNLTDSDKGLWGGLILLGNAGNNTVPAVQNIEGIPTSETRGQFGGSDDADNSGTLKYISIRHGGTNIGADNEINGLTLGGVGSGTTIEHVEVYANNDDGIEFFGGTANIKYAVVSHCGDDSYDYDMGWRGKGQFWLTVQNEADGNRAGEHDGGTDPEDGTPFATPEIRNATYIGNGLERCITFRDNAGGSYINSIFSGWDQGIDIEDLEGDTQDSKKRLEAGDLTIENNVFYSITAGSEISALIVSSTGEDLSTNASVTGNTVANPNISATNPVASGLSPGSTPSDAWFTSTSVKGAFEASNWAEGWTKLYE